MDKYAASVAAKIRKNFADVADFPRGFDDLSFFYNRLSRHLGLKTKLNLALACTAATSSRRRKTRPLPKKAPERWRDRDDHWEQAPAFIQRIYRPWLGNGLTRSDILRLDPDLHKALRVWLYKNGGSLPKGLVLPMKKEITDQELAKYGLSQDHPVIQAASRIYARQRMRRLKS